MMKWVVLAGVVFVGGVLMMRTLGGRQQEGESSAGALAPPAQTRTLGDASSRLLYVAPNGQASADGSRAHPFDLVTALKADGPTSPGDTVLLLNGTYSGNFVADLRGAEAAPIVIREAPGEHAVISAASATEPALKVNGLWTWYAGLELLNEHPERETALVQNVPIRQGVGVTIGAAAHIKFIDLVVHDLEGGFQIPADAADIEMYGNVVYYNGWQRADGVGEGHGVLSPSQSDGRYVRDNIIFDNFSHGIQAYGNALDNLYIEGNVLFDNGGIAKYLDRNVMIGPGSKNLVFRQNMTYYTAGPAAIGEGVNLGFGGDCSHAAVDDNYLTGSNPLNLTLCRPSEMHGNTLHGRFDTALAQKFPDNHYMTPKEPPMPTMSGMKVFVRPNRYDPARATVVVYNWDRLPAVSVDVASTGLKTSDEYELRDAQNFFGQPVVTGTYRGGPLTVPMRGRTVARVLGPVTTQPPKSDVEFGVFVLINRSRIRETPASTTN